MPQLTPTTRLTSRSTPLRALALTCALAIATPVMTAQEDPTALRKAVQSALQAQDWQTAQESAAKLVKQNEKDGTAWFQLGYALHAQKKLGEALTAHKRAEQFAPPRLKPIASYNISCVYAIQNKPDAAFASLSKAIDAGFNDINTLKTDADMTNLRKDPRFKQAFARVAKAAKSVPMTAFAYSSSRQSARLAYFKRGGSGGQLAIDYGPVPWQDKYESSLTNDRFTNRRWRLGANAWTNFDTSTPVTMAGKQLKVGLYYMTLTHKGDNKFVLHLLDPAVIRESGIDPYMAQQTTGGIEIELQHEVVEASAKKLKIELLIEDKQNNTDVTFKVSFGTHRLTAPMKVATNR